MSFPILENLTKSARHSTFYLSCGDPKGTPIIFVHGWPELSIAWNRQLPAFAALGFHCVAPDMRGYGRSSIPGDPDAYALREVVADMIELLDSMGAAKAIWVGHDWGSPVVWSIAQHHADRCHGVASLCLPYLPNGFTPENFIAQCNRAIYPADKFPAAQWDYILYYGESFERARVGFEADVANSVRIIFRSGDPSGQGKPSMTAFIRANNGWFGPPNVAPAAPPDRAVLTAEDESAYIAAFAGAGFFGPDCWYVNTDANRELGLSAPNDGALAMPVLFLHAAYDFVCETLDSSFPEPMRGACADLTEVTVPSGHWMAQEKPTLVNAALAKWLAAKFPELWETS